MTRDQHELRKAQKSSKYVHDGKGMWTITCRCGWQSGYRASEVQAVQSGFAHRQGRK